MRTIGGALERMILRGGSAAGARTTPRYPGRAAGGGWPAAVHLVTVWVQDPLSEESWTTARNSETGPFARPASASQGPQVNVYAYFLT